MSRFPCSFAGAATITCFLFLALASQGAAQTDWDFVNGKLSAWLQSTMEAYPQWLRENRMDPSPVVEGPEFLDENLDWETIQLTLTLTNHTATGQACEGQYIRGSGSLYNMNRRIFLEHENYGDDTDCPWTFSGNYVASGEVRDEETNTTIEFQREGRFNMTLPRAYTRLKLVQYEVDDERGIIDVNSGLESEFNAEPYFYYFLCDDIQFENFWDRDGDSDELLPYETQIKQKIEKVYKQHYMFMAAQRNIHPLSIPLKQYWETMANSTSLADVIGYWPVEPAYDWSFSQHLRGLLTNYSKHYLPENGMDPSPPLEQEIRMPPHSGMIPPEHDYIVETSLFTANNHYIKDHSKNYEEDNLRLTLGSVENQHRNAALRKFTKNNWRYGGTYEAKGLVRRRSGGAEVEFKGSGNFSLTLTDIEEYYSCIDFTINEESFIQLDGARCSYFFMTNTIAEEGEFEGLEGVDEPLSEEYRKMASYQLKYIYFIEVIRESPMELYPPHFPEVSQGRAQFIEYFRQKVPETSLKEIIGHWP